MAANMIPKAQLRRPRPVNAYYHASKSGTGTAIQFELHPAHDYTEGSLFVSLAAQKSIGNPMAGAFANFDWENKICIKLDKSDLSQILQVFRGIQESVNDGKGLLHRSNGANTIIKFSHQIDPHPGYLLSVSKRTSNGDERHGYFFFSPSEAFELDLAIESSMMFISFGIPVVVYRDVPSATYKEEEVQKPIAL